MSDLARFREAGTRPASGGGYGLPGDLLRKSRARVRIVAVLVLVGASPDFVLTVGQSVGRLLYGTGEFPDTLQFVANLLIVTSAVTLMLAAGSARVRDGSLLRFALAFEVVLCLVVSLAGPDVHSRTPARCRG